MKIQGKTKKNADECRGQLLDLLELCNLIINMKEPIFDKFIKNKTQLAEPLYKSLHNNEECKWTIVRQEAFDSKIKINKCRNIYAVQ